MKETGTITKINQTGQYPTKDRDTKQPITMKIYSIDFKHLQNTTYYNPHDLKVQVGDFVEFEYNQADKKVSAIKKIVQPMHGNYKPNNNYEKKPVNEYEARLNTSRSILLQVAFKEASQAYIAGKITQDEVATLTNKYFDIIDK
tara:strand:- start:273 stop:704 length:432 start_codon:yes stop_codon:yes gene_type:complete